MWKTPLERFILFIREGDYFGGIVDLTYNSNGIVSYQQTSQGAT